mgnify:CR=1 FL=1
MLHKQSPRPGAFWAPGRGREVRFCRFRARTAPSRRTKKLPPPMTQTQKNSKAPERYAPGPAVIFFMDNGSIFSGALRRLVRRLVHRLCGNHGNTLCYRFCRPHRLSCRVQYPCNGCLQAFFFWPVSFVPFIAYSVLNT